ncbi:radical SAM family heme chaperone HemW [Algibacter amylolyticus]|uniref:Heme chaperone HemW n=1 Tax=Algibacter amylolyticus TaxID=1608400 RepID=A0A5M7BFZ9_9FLAO|nr:radical SAM family heme chaperone HemW [Algibacter amylolyticus]TSJ82474.1 radical SAM family heme chaperone HemW [Algibacter amylolyticus]
MKNKLKGTSTNSAPSGRLGGASASIYIHIPFCKQACHYCDFHFSTSLKKKEELIQCLVQELKLRKNELESQNIETIYFGGGTPSLLSCNEFDFIIDAAYKYYNIVEHPEITLEANPDDLSESVIQELAKSRINRLSIGIQSFYESDLKLMNRAHNAKEALKCLEEATKHFDNISVDLIYGIPGLTNAAWIKNIETALAFNVPHISCYALTVEPKTALETFIKKGVIANVDDDLAQEQFNILVDTLEAEGFVNYELSNFGKPEYFSKNNSAYWLGKPYLGIGPSAHSFNGDQRSWNVSNNTKYIKSIQNNTLPNEIETLSKTDKFNEYIMTGLRTVWGVSLEKIENDFGETYKNYLLKQSEIYIQEHLLYIDGNKLLTTKKGKFLSDGIAANLFKINLS